MSAPLFINPANSDTYATTPYITVSEYLRAPTSVDTSALVSDGTSTDQTFELANVIDRASSWADSLCDQIIAASVNTETADDLFVRRDGYVDVVLGYWPLLQVNTFAAGPRPSQLTTVTNTADIWMKGRKVLKVPVAGLGDTGSVPFLGVGCLQPGSRAFAQWSYMNGYPVATLAASCLAAATSIVISNADGVYAGTQLTIYDGSNTGGTTEVVTVADTYTLGSTTLPLVAPTVSAHTVPAAPDAISVTSLPPAIKQAVISLTSCLVKLRGNGAIVMESIDSEPAKMALIESDGMEDLAIAVDLLDRFKRVTG